MLRTIQKFAALAFMLVFMLICAQSKAQTCASMNFTSSVKIGCSPLVVKFTAKGAPAGSIFSWDFGGGAVTGFDTIFKAFTVPGKYTITLKVTTPTGTVCTIVKTDSITVLPTPAPNIKVEPGKLVCTGPQEVKFTDNTTDIVEREWIIDGVSYKDLATVTHKFTSSGYKSLSLKVKNKAGCIGLLSENKFINITDTVPTEFCGDITITDKDIQATFTPNVTIASPRTITKYEWTFPGGTPSSYVGKTPPLVKYKLNNIPQDVKLVVTTGEGCKYTALRKNYIQQYIQTSTDSLCMGRSVSISNKAINNGRGFFEWGIIDGMLVGEPKPEGVSLKYNSAGKFDLKLSFKYSEYGCKSTVNYIGYVNSLGPKAHFESLQQAVCDPNTKILLTNRTNEFGATNVMYTWRIYDSLDKPMKGMVFGPTRVKDATFIIKEFGRFGVSLTAKSSNGCSDSVFQSKFINISNPSIVSIETDTPAFCMGETVTFYSKTNPADEKGDAFKYIWNIQHTKISSLFFTVLGSMASWQPTYPGEYDITHIIENGTGCGDTFTRKAMVKSVGALATVTLDQTTGCAGMGTRAVAKVLDKYPNTPDNIVKYQWAVDPDDGVNIINPKSQIAYIQFWESGTFDVILNIIDQEGCTTQIIEDDLVKLGVTSGFTMPANKCLGDTLDVPVYASLDAETYKWTLSPPGAGVIYPSDTVRDIKVIYNQDTCYTLQLVTSKTVLGRLCTDTSSYTKCVVLPEAGFVTNDTSLYCAPVVANFESKSKFAKKYLWEFGDGTSLMNESEKISHVYMKNSLTGFSVKMTAIDSNGCFESVTSNNLIKIVGPEPKFAIDKKIGCDNTLIKFTNLSKNIKNFVLIYDDGTVLDSNTVEDHQYEMEDNGMDSMIFYPILLATDATNCPAFHKDTIVIYRSPEAAFYSDTLNACVPYNAGFKNTSMRAKKWWWDFENDGIYDDSTENPRHVYTKPGLYSIKLKVKNNGGCFDSIVMQNYINVDPIPSAKFSCSQNKFCNSADIDFTDSGKSYNYYLFDFGDGSPLETSTMPQHKYVFREGVDKGDSVVFYPKQIVYNSAGCTDTFIDTIIVYARPVSGYVENILSGCSPLTVEFTDTSKHSALTEWDFDNDGIAETTGTKVQYTFTSGTYTVKQKNTSGFGCTDSFIKVNRIKVNEPPVADFAVSDSVICYGEKVQFTDLSTPQANLRKWQWFFDEIEVKADTSHLQHPEFSFYTAGYHTIKLIVQDDEGCMDSIVKKAVFVEDTLQPANSQLLYVSVTQDGKIDIAWSKNTVYDFAEYRLERSGDVASLINTSKHFSDTAYMDADPTLTTLTRSYCYTISTADACKNISMPSQEHCTILLQTVDVGSGKTRLTWNSYTGWPQVKEYRIFRAGKENIYTQIATVAGNVLIYNDSNLCDETYCYYVEAAHTNGRYFSRSNLSCIHPVYTYQTIAPELEYATVVNNEAVKIKWNAQLQTNVTAYIIDRFTSANGWETSYSTSTDTVFTDMQTNVSAQNYAYRVRTQDACGYFGPYSNNASSIYLTARPEKDKIVLNWNKYYKWQKGINKYELQIRNRNGKFETINYLLAGDSTYTDDSVYVDIDTAYCYRIIAHEEGLYPQTSVSNIACATLAPRIYAPNAFSPNNDGLNDVWKVSSVSIYNQVGSEIKNFHLQIFDRWGSLIFESSNVHQGWDGTRNSVKLPVGVYVYLVKAEGLNGNFIHLRGNITLIK